MKVQNITNIEKFFEVVDSCSGKVELVTGEGDRLNLKSKLSQYVSMANIFSNGEIPELEIVAHEKEDIDKLVAFMINGQTVKLIDKRKSSSGGGSILAFRENTVTVFSYYAKFDIVIL